METITAAIAEYVSEALKTRRSSRVRAPKMIHDTIHGSNLYYEHEIAILDLPLLQRLRYINQVDFVPLVFPSGNHNRFEHTLGVTVVAEKLLKALETKKIEKIEITENDRNNVRMAAIMHDCGHGPFSHISEEIYRSYPCIKAIQKNEKFYDRSPHEILSYFIVTSEPFKEFVEREINPQYNVELDVELIGNMIIGWITDPEKAYLVDIINGPFDADKLDYIQRDSHFTGIKMVLDVDRLFYTICTVRDQNVRKRLSVDLTGVSTLEQIIFNKMMLYSTVYHHHKVRAAECMFKGIVEVLKSRDEGFFSEATDFLQFTDYDFYGLKTLVPSIRERIEELQYRSLYKRALVISQKTIDQDSKERNYSFDIMKLYDKPELIDTLREAIYEEAKKRCNCSLHDIWVDMPIPPSSGEPAKCLVKMAGTDETIRLRDVFPIDEWITAFNQNKYQGYVFCPERIRKEVSRAAKTVIEDIYKIKFNKYAEILCKMDNNNDLGPAEDQ